MKFTEDLQNLFNPTPPNMIILYNQTICQFFKNNIATVLQTELPLAFRLRQICHSWPHLSPCLRFCIVSSWSLKFNNIIHTLASFKTHKMPLHFISFSFSLAVFSVKSREMEGKTPFLISRRIQFAWFFTSSFISQFSPNTFILFFSPDPWSPALFSWICAPRCWTKAAPGNISNYLRQKTKTSTEANGLELWGRKILSATQILLEKNNLAETICSAHILWTSILDDFRGS